MQKTKRQKNLDKRRRELHILSSGISKQCACVKIWELLHKCRSKQSDDQSLKSKLTRQHRQLAWESSKSEFPRQIWRTASGSYDSLKVPSKKKSKKEKEKVIVRPFPEPIKDAHFSVIGCIPKSFLGRYSEAAVTQKEFLFLTEVVELLPPEIHYHHDDSHEFFWLELNGRRVEITTLESRLDRLLALVFQPLDGSELRRVLFYSTNPEEVTAMEMAMVKEGKLQRLTGTASIFNLIVVGVFIEHLPYDEVLYCIDDYLRSVREHGVVKTSKMILTRKHFSRDQPMNRLLA